jgi:RNA polymerase sigma-70 factor, ECF subfamily
MNSIDKNTERDLDTEFAMLLGDVQQALFDFIFVMLQNRADAEDVYQQCAVVMWKKFASFSPGTSFINWALQIARYEIKDFVKARRRRKVFFSNAVLDAIAMSYQPEPKSVQDQRIETLSRCVDKLSDRDRRMLYQCYAVDRDYRKIAQVEGKSTAAIYQAISRIRKALYICVQRHMAKQK